jgi:hypothetical protein
MQLPQPNQHDGLGPDMFTGAGSSRRHSRRPESLLSETGSKDDLPDLLWPALVLAEQGNDAIRNSVSWQKAVQDALSEHDETAFVAESLDGRLTTSPA